MTFSQQLLWIIWTLSSLSRMLASVFGNVLTLICKLFKKDGAQKKIRSVRTRAMKTHTNSRTPTKNYPKTGHKANNTSVKKFPRIALWGLGYSFMKDVFDAASSIPFGRAMQWIILSFGKIFELVIFSSRGIRTLSKLMEKIGVQDKIRTWVTKLFGTIYNIHWFHSDRTRVMNTQAQNLTPTRSYLNHVSVKKIDVSRRIDPAMTNAQGLGRWKESGIALWKFSFSFMKGAFGDLSIRQICWDSMSSCLAILQWAMSAFREIFALVIFASQKILALSSNLMERCSVLNKIRTKLTELFDGFYNTFWFRSDMAKDMKTLAETLAPPESYLKAGHKAKKLVFELLQSNAHLHNFSIGRTRLAGSVGKGTCISYKDGGITKYPDFDCVVFINDLQPPFTGVLEKMEEILMGHPLIFGIHRTQTTLHFNCRMDNYTIKFDLLPSMNYVKHTDAPSLQGEDVRSLAQEEALRNFQDQLVPFRNDVERIRIQSRFHSSSFTEGTVACISEYAADANICEVIRLAKYWNSKIFIGEYVPGRSCMIELIAINVARKRRCCVLTAFRNFLQQMANLRFCALSLNVSVPPHFHNASGPVIVDPANPYNNIASGIGESAISVFEMQAKETLKILDDLRADNEEKYPWVTNPLDKIFREKRGSFTGFERSSPYYGGNLIIILLVLIFLHLVNQQ